MLSSVLGSCLYSLAISKDTIGIRTEPSHFSEPVGIVARVVCALDQQKVTVILTFSDLVTDFVIVTACSYRISAQTQDTS